VGRAETCPSCGTDLKSCKNCAFYDTGSYNQCREIQAERVLEKERSNYCDYFLFRDSSRNMHTQDKKSDLKGQLDSLFKK